MMICGWRKVHLIFILRLFRIVAAAAAAAAVRVRVRVLSGTLTFIDTTLIQQMTVFSFASCSTMVAAATARGCARRSIASTAIPAAWSTATSASSHRLVLGQSSSPSPSPSPSTAARAAAATIKATSTSSTTSTRPSMRFASSDTTISFLHTSSGTTSIGSFREPSNRVADVPLHDFVEEELPGSRAFVECDRNALIDLFHKYAVDCDVSGRYLDLEGLRQLLRAVGEHLDQETLERLFQSADINGDGTIELDEFLHSSDVILGSAPAGIILVVGGPGSGKGVLSNRLVKECGIVHLSSGDLLRDEVRRDTVLGKQVREIMERGELVSSAVIVTLMRRVMRNHPGKRVLLDGFPRSLQNAHDLVELCGVPELALHLECDDTILMERILKRGAQSTASGTGEGRADDNIHTALKRLRTYHKYHNSTLEWLREQHVPVVNLDCSGSADSVWEQLCAIGRLMRPATKIDPSSSSTAAAILPNGMSGSRGGSPLGASTIGSAGSGTSGSGTSSGSGNSNDTTAATG